jgi:hypothetical protein
VPHIVRRLALSNVCPHRPGGPDSFRAILVGQRFGPEIVECAAFHLGALKGAFPRRVGAAVGVALAVALG